MGNKYQEIYFGDILRTMGKKWWLILIFIVVGASTGYYVTRNYIEPTYKADAILFIGKEKNSLGDIGVSLNDLNKNDQLFVDYQQLAGTRLVVEEVVKNLNVDISIESFKQSMEVYTIENSRLFGVSFTSNNPRLAADAANELAKQIALAAAKIVEVENIRVVDPALVPMKYIKPDIIMNTGIAGFLGLVFVLFIIFILILLDNTIKNEEDILKITKLPVIGTIPKFKGENRI